MLVEARIDTEHMGRSIGYPGQANRAHCGSRTDRLCPSASQLAVLLACLVLAAPRWAMPDKPQGFNPPLVQRGNGMQISATGVPGQKTPAGSEPPQLK